MNLMKKRVPVYKFQTVVYRNKIVALADIGTLILAVVKLIRSVALLEKLIVMVHVTTLVQIVRHGIKTHVHAKIQIVLAAVAKLGTAKLVLVSNRIKRVREYAKLGTAKLVLVSNRIKRVREHAERGVTAPAVVSQILLAVPLRKNAGDVKNGVFLNALALERIIVVKA